MYKKEYVKEYYNLADIKRPKIGGLIMMKNERLRLSTTLDSFVKNDKDEVIRHIDAVIFLDTGSTDNTKEIAKEWAEKNKVNIYLASGPFIDFSTSRNISLDFADTINVDYLLLCDVNDELRGFDNLYKLAEENMYKNTDAFLILQRWKHGNDTFLSEDSYYNLRFIKARQGYRYRGCVHEYLIDSFSATDQPRNPIFRVEGNICLFQDRTKDDDKSMKRFSRDREILMKSYLQNPNDPRTLFYLAQTCQCLNMHEEAVYYSKLRLEHIGFEEEIFHTYIRIGQSCMILGHDWSEASSWFLKACEKFDRAEPFVKLADYYRAKAVDRESKGMPVENIWQLAYMFIAEGCKLPFPEQAILFVDKACYDYYRWYVFAQIAYKLGKFTEGKEAVKKSLEASKKRNQDVEANEELYKKYMEQEKGTDTRGNESTLTSRSLVTSSGLVTSSKQEFIRKHAPAIVEKFPGITEAQLKRRVEAMWKKKGKA